MRGSTRLPHEPVVERVSWALVTALLALTLAWLILPIVLDSSETSTAEETEGQAEDSSEATEETANSEEEPVGASDTDTQDSEAATESESDTFTITAAGEITIHRRVAEAAQTADGFDFTPLFANVKPRIEGADLSICHLETPLSATNTDLSYGEGGVFRAPNQIADALKDTGFDLCSTASEHAYDSGLEGLSATVAQLTRVGIPHAGIATTFEQADTRWRVNVKGTTVGHLSYTFGVSNPGNADLQDHEVARIAEAQILAAAANHRAGGSDFIIVSLHWGDEYQPVSDAQQTLGASLLANPNIDLILGHHAHIPQRIDEINGEYIVYGLGNFLTNQSSSAPECPVECTLETQDGMIVEFTVDMDAEGDLAVVGVDVIPTWVDVGNTWQIFDTTLDAQPSGAAFDAAVLQASQERTRAIVGVG